MKSIDLIGFAIAAVVLLVEYWGTRKIVVPNRFTKFLLAIVIPIVVLIVAVILQPKYFILGIVGIICLFSIPILLTVSVRNKVIHLGDTLHFSENLGNLSVTNIILNLIILPLRWKHK